MRKIIFGLLALTAISCNSQKTTKEFSLTGFTNAIQNGTFLYLDNILEKKIIDSAKVENNSFYFHTKLTESPLRVVLHTKDRSKYRYLWLENNEMIFDARKTDFKQANVTGSITEDLKQRLRKEIDGLSKDERQKKEMEFVKNNPNSIVSMAVLAVYSKTWGKEKTKELFDLFSTENKNSEYGKRISKFIELNKTPNVGERYIDFELEDTNGKIKKLSDLKDKIVLLEFWGSLCGPCRKENPNLVKTYEKYNPYGFEIFAVSLDSDKINWLNAIAKDKLPWLHVSDLKGSYNSASLIYGIHTIPANFLIDRDGTIVDRNLQGDKLNIKLAELISVDKKGYN
ncbi:redoxin domain-containing protein [Mariniflexile gromovii]|uniref:AhpC/TSA family protein n=1 Tax=Mariniflexile gromovii TaxID=362523 RepID=A0ABS4BYL7_9FLAO|nr:TlpA disulfide reductase family protein [Mariniflexile gromovii]MBP0905671.1 AhpC/TSA family protein [Mariniflexile gromovii]